MSADTLTTELDRLAAMVRRLRPDWRDAEAFYALRSEVSGGVGGCGVSGGWAALGRRLHTVPPPVTRPVTPAPPPTPRPKLINGFARKCPVCGKPFFAMHAKRALC